MRDLCIRPMDTGDDDQNSKSIQVLIEADRRQTINWTTANLAMRLIGNIFGLDYHVSNIEAYEDAAGFVISTFISDENVAELWSLNTLRIKNPIETKSLKECKKEIHEVFLKTIQLNEDGRYEVSIVVAESPGIQRQSGACT